MEDILEDLPNSVIVRRLTKLYGNIKAIDNVSFRIGKGEIVGFLGPNGAGKSTTMRILSGLTTASSGSVHICGISVANYPEKIRKLIGYMPENNPLPEDLRVIEYLRMRAKIKGLNPKTIKSKVDEVMEVCQLHRKASKKIIGNLSKGFKQRVGIADVILAEPKIVIMDEPTIGLDPHQILGIRNLINSLRGKMSVIISSHILPEVEMMCDRVVIINNGQIVASGTSQSLNKEFISENRYELSLRANKQDFEKLLMQISDDLIISKESAQDIDGYITYELKTKNNKDLGVNLIAELSKDSSLGLRQVNKIKPTLEDIFMLATRRSWEQEKI